MADYTDQDPNTLLPGEPWTSAKSLAAFENPVAIAEGAPGAPRVRAAALSPVGGLFVGIFNSDINDNVTDFGGGQVFFLSGAVNSSSAFQIQFSTDGGSSYGTAIPVGGGSTGGENVPMSAVIDLVNGRVSICSTVDVGSLTIRPRSSTTSVTVPAGTNAFRFKLSGTGTFAGLLFAIGGAE